ncbi:RNA polymerase II elongation factor ELL2-like [Dreissena polymorpha]|uniref:OCEL domain-containing protein n=1 Tax=Dreissena polymorpha TaxID=45954 RepID=A0A9D4K4T2_DREPO|nr:RNA polymerase II elongation factor ELL2-like [Dreissena polymorpha]KAH3833030.1 hypothetical protein DPMN_106333 [Dreissena polymorpha]
MAALEEGFQYGLSSNSISSTNKSVVQVKLTDTSLRIFEEYVRGKASLGRKPSIQFHGNLGTIQIPEGDQMRTFQFTLSALEANGSFDALCQPNTRGGGHLTLEGSMTNKIQIHATNELFQTTKERVTQAEIDSKKVSTKVIKQSGPHISRKKTTVIRNAPPPQHAPSRPSPAPPAKPKPPTAPPVNFVKRPSPSYASHGHAVSPHNPTSSSKPLSPNLNALSNAGLPSSHGNQPTNQNAGLPSSHGNQPTNQSSAAKSSGNPAVTSMPYRDRIIHLLAVRSYKRPELLIRLRKDGENKKDKDQLGTILSQVAVSKDNVFSLAKHIYPEVRMDWPFYTEEDREILKKKLQKPSSVSPSASPANRSPDSQTTTTVSQKKSESLKRSIEETNHSTHSAKKIRIAHGSRPPHTVGLDEKHAFSHNSVSSTTDISDKKENIDDTVDSTSDIPEYMRHYFTISNDDQRCKYKQDFNTEYDEYRDLHAKIENVSQKFVKLQVERNKLKRDSMEFKDIEDRIREEYRSQKSDIKFVEQKKRFEYLHKKLAYIKKLILDYDQKYLTTIS